MNNAGFLSIESVRENQLANLSKQIDNLKEENDRLEDINEELMEERNRLNNIINEIRRLLKEEYYQDIAVGKILRMIDKDSDKE